MQRSFTFAISVCSGIVWNVKIGTWQPAGKRASNSTYYTVASALFSAELPMACVSAFMVKLSWSSMLNTVSLHRLRLTHTFASCIMRLSGLHKIWVEFWMSIKVTFHFIWTVFTNSSVKFFHAIYDKWNGLEHKTKDSATELHRDKIQRLYNGQIFSAVQVCCFIDMKRYEIWEDMAPQMRVITWFFWGNHREVSNQRLSRVRKALKESSEGELHCFSLQKTSFRS